MLSMLSISHRFRLSNTGTDILSLHISSCKIDTVKKQLHITVRQPLDDGSLMKYIESLSESYNNILSFELLDGNGNTTSSTNYRVKAINHSIDYDYASTDVATHSLILKYKIIN